MIADLTNIQPNKVSTNINDYSLLITAPTGFGKTPFLYELYGERALFLSFENSAKGIEGIHAVAVEDYNTLNAYIMQLQKKEVREKYDVVVIDTLFLFDHYIEKSVLDSYGKDVLSDCLQYNKAYKILDKKFLEVLKKIQRMNYTIAYVCHPTEKKVKLADGSEITKIEPRVSDRIKNLLLPEIDVRLFGYFDNNGEKVLYTDGSQFFDARVRVGDMDKVVPFNVEKFKQEFAIGIERRIKRKEMMVDSIEHKNPAFTAQRPFEEVMEEIIEIGNKLGEKGLLEKANNIIFKELGSDNNGVQRTLANCNENNVPALEVILTNLKALL